MGHHTFLETDFGLYVCGSNKFGEIGKEDKNAEINKIFD